MDSVSQFALGACIGDVTLGRHIGRKAMLVGGIVATLPDLDVLIRYTDAVESFTYHRGWSHSLFVLTLISPMIAFALFRVFRHYFCLPHQYDARSLVLSPGFPRWLLFTWLVLLTHALLDGFTIYGTQLFWPLDVPPVAIGSIFIIDPLYTLPLLLAIWLAASQQKARVYGSIGLAISTGYLALTLYSQHQAGLVAERSLIDRQISTDQVIVAPFPFSLGWRVVAIDPPAHYEGFYSHLDDSSIIQFKSFNNNRDLIVEHYNFWSINRLEWFTRGFVAATLENDLLIINDLRMGIEDDYVFRFAVGEKSADGFVPVQSRLLPLSIDTTRLKALFQRIWNEDIDI